MVLYIIGLGLLQSDYLTIKGSELIKLSNKIYFYESPYQPFNKLNLEKFIGRSLLSIYHNNIFNDIKNIVEESQINDISLLMPGDPFCDHIYPKLKLECTKLSVSLKVIHNACLLNYISNSGLQLYRFAETIYADTSTQVKKILETAKANNKKDLHTLIIFDPTLSTYSQLISTLKEDSTSTVEDHSLKDIVLISVSESSLQISPMLHLDSDFTEYKSSCVRALILVGKCHEMEESVLKYMSCNNDSILKDRGTFHLIGLGLGHPEDVTIKGQMAIRNASSVFLEGYTSIMIGGKSKLEDYFGKEITVADREIVESNTHLMLDGLKEGNVAFLVVGDPLGATTHTDLIIRAAEEASSVDIIHNASIINAVAVSGLNPNHFGEVTSIPYWEETWKPDSFYDKICSNYARGLHTLCLLDIKVKEQSLENLLRGRKIYEKPRYMSVSQAAKQLTQIIESHKENDQITLVNSSANVICLARIGTDFEVIKMSTLDAAIELDMGEPLHSLIIVGSTSQEENDVLNTFT